jgi:hypothetical protein
MIFRMMKSLKPDVFRQYGVYYGIIQSTTRANGKIHLIR